MRASACPCRFRVPEGRGPRGENTSGAFAGDVDFAVHAIVFGAQSAVGESGRDFLDNPLNDGFIRDGRSRHGWLSSICDS